MALRARVALNLRSGPSIEPDGHIEELEKMQPKNAGGTEVACRCGEVRIDVSGEPVDQFYCHCDDCQAISGGAYLGVAIYPASAVRVTRGQPRTWKYKTMPRTFCATCGTRLFGDVTDFGQRGVMAALLPPGAFRPEFHINCCYAVAPVRDGLPHYKAFPEKFGGTGEPVGW
jgi:hypothetical protein